MGGRVGAGWVGRAEAPHAQALPTRNQFVLCHATCTTPCLAPDVVPHTAARGRVPAQRSQPAEVGSTSPCSTRVLCLRAGVRADALSRAAAVAARSNSKQVLNDACDMPPRRAIVNTLAVNDDGVMASGGDDGSLWCAFFNLVLWGGARRGDWVRDTELFSTRLSGGDVRPPSHPSKGFGTT